MKSGTGQSLSSESATTQRVSPSVLTPAFVIQTYSDAEWEAFILEYLGAANPPYEFIEPKGGPGDKGRDILAYVVGPPGKGPIDIFQCKAYQKRLTPSDTWIELAKLCVYTLRGDYPLPRRYLFVSPLGVGTKLGDLLNYPERLRQGLISKWDADCRDKISATESFPLEGKLKAYIDAFDFGIIGYVPVHEILEQHRRTSYWHLRFKRDYPIRPEAVSPPTGIQDCELRYVRQLLDAYEDYLKRPLKEVVDLQTEPTVSDHFQRSRTDFFMADSLNRFYRDQFPEGAFDHVKKQVYDGVVETANGPHSDGLARVRATVQQAAQLPLAQTQYTPYVEPGDKKGLCHHLANDDKLRWVHK